MSPLDGPRVWANMGLVGHPTLESLLIFVTYPGRHISIPSPLFLSGEGSSFTEVCYHSSYSEREREKGLAGAEREREREREKDYPTVCWRGRREPDGTPSWCGRRAYVVETT